MGEHVMQIKSGKTKNVDMSAIFRESMCAKEDYIWNCSSCTCKNGKYLKSINDNSVVIGD